MKLTQAATSFAVFLLVVGTVMFILPTSALPVSLTSPISDSMEPTIGQGDVVIVTTSSSVETGDIALYNSPDDGNPVLHRIVGETDDGFTTQGDANEVTDQDAGGSTVTTNDITGSVLTVGDTPIVIPYLGHILLNPIALFAMWLFVATASIAGTGKDGLTVVHDQHRGWAYVFALLLVIILPIVITATAATAGVSIITTDVGSEDQSHLVTPGEQGFAEATVTTPAPFGVTHVATVDGDDLRVESITPTEEGNGVDVTVSNEPQDEPGGQEGTVTVYTYPNTLPSPVIEHLAAYHPLVAAIATASVLSFAIIILALIVLDPKQPLRRSRESIRRGWRSDRNPTNPGRD